MTKLPTLLPSSLFLLSAFKSRRSARSLPYAQRELSHGMHMARCPANEGRYLYSEMDGNARAALVGLRTGLAIENQLAFR